jgi:L-seryl-tRNA(Ser) seleniumtransferase
MAIKPPDLLNRLPSVSELLEKPPIRALADRWNRSVVAGGVRSFLEELRSDFERRAADLPSIRELAERAARFVVSRQHHSMGVAINATGRICGSPWTTTPLAEAALERMIALGREYAIEPGAASAKSRSELQASLARLTGSQAAAVVHSYSGALWLALAALAADREVLVARAEVGDVDGADSLPKLATAANTTLKEVGATNRTSAADYEAAVSPRAAAILKLSNDSYRVVGETAAAELDELVALARDRELLSIDALGAAPLVTPPATIPWPRRSAQASLAAGADLVIIRGDALVGGPACGILLGRQDAIRRITEHPLFAAWQLDPLRAAALTATMACYDHPSFGADSAPVWQCLSTSVENLRNRAERMAAQLAHVEGVASASAIETRSPISASLPGEGWPSHGVALAAADGNLATLDNRLQTARVPIRGRIEGDRIILDLRTVLPRQDKTLVDALLGPTTPQTVA